MANDYDIAEATDLFARMAAGRDRTGRAVAADKLKAAIVSIVESGTGNFRLEEDPSSPTEIVIVRSNRISARLFFDEDGVSVRDSGTSAARPLPLDYDPIRKLFVSNEEDCRVHPTPGVARSYRDATAIIMQEVWRLENAHTSP